MSGYYPSSNAYQNGASDNEDSGAIFHTTEYIPHSYSNQYRNASNSNFSQPVFHPRTTPSGSLSPATSSGSSSASYLREGSDYGASVSEFQTSVDNTSSANMARMHMTQHNSAAVQRTLQHQRGTYIPSQPSQFAEYGSYNSSYSSQYPSYSMSSNERASKKLKGSQQGRLSSGGTDAEYPLGSSLYSSGSSPPQRNAVPPMPGGLVGYPGQGRSNSLPVPPAPGRPSLPYGMSRQSTPSAMSPQVRAGQLPSQPPRTGSGFQHGPTELPPRPYGDGENLPGPPKARGKIPGSAMEYLPILEQRFNRLEGAVEQYIDYRAQVALKNSYLPDLDDPKPTGSSTSRSKSAQKPKQGSSSRRQDDE